MPPKKSNHWVTPIPPTFWPEKDAKGDYFKDPDEKPKVIYNLDWAEPIGCESEACSAVRTVLESDDKRHNYFFAPHSRCAKRPLAEGAEEKDERPSKRIRIISIHDPAKSWTNEMWQERLKPCSGRDEMCRQVLNDDWASHPTWASEDSGFVAHRKNTFEESLHRIEEERHDYDFGIEANNRVIALLEPIAQSLLSMSPEERANFRMPIGLGGHSQAIYKRVFKKVYGERGTEVAADLFKDPSAVLPIVLARIKQKDEEWRFAQVSPLSHFFSSES
jgi:paired amphipathic helix protein Sin3a